MLDYTIHQLKYAADSSAYMNALAQLPMPAFLESGQADPGLARFDILSAAPEAYLTITDGEFSSSDPDIGLTTEGFFPALRELQAKYGASEMGIPSEIGPLPFSGGLIGVLGYPKLNTHKAFSFEQAFAGFYSWALIVDHLKESSKLIFMPRCTPQFISEITSLLESNNLPIKSINFYDFELKQAFKTDTTPEEYGLAFARIKDYIDAGDCYQVNLTQRFSSHYTGEPLAAYLKLRESSLSPFSGFIAWQDQALLCNSPERFLSVRQGHVITQPIKGTRPRGIDSKSDRSLAEELQSSEKDRAENLMIVDLLRNDLGKVCSIGSVKMEKLFELQSFNSVHHLVSTVSGYLDEKQDALDLLEACFPGGSITGAPKLRAMQIIEELESHAREAYCGSLFYLDCQGNMDSNITIRSLLCSDGEIHCWAGGGIVSDSVLADEYTECFDKINILIK